MKYLALALAMVLALCGEARAVFYDLHINGQWDPTTNDQKLIPGKGQYGDVYIVSKSGTFALDGQSFWAKGDFLVFGLNDKWNKISGQAVGNLCAPIDLYGADPTGVAYSDAAWTAAATASCVSFGQGTYKFLNPITRSVGGTNSFTVVGQGAGATKLLWPNTGGGMTLVITALTASVHTRDLSLLTGVANGGSGLLIQETVASPNPASQALSDVSNVNVGGSDNLGAFYWGSGFEVDRASNIDFVNPGCIGGYAGGGVFNGACVNLHGTSTTIPVQFNFSGCSFYLFSYGIYYGDYVQGVTVNQCNFTTGTYGIYTPSTAHLLAQLAVTNSQFNVAAVAIDTLVNPAPSLISNNMFIVPTNGFGIDMTNAGLFSIVGNNFFPQSGGSTGNTGVHIASSTAAGTITGNTFYSMKGFGVILSAPSGLVNVQSNAYQSNGTNTLDQGTGNTIGGGSP